MLRVVLDAWVTKTSAAESLANPAARRRQVTMTSSLNHKRRRFPWLNCGETNAAGRSKSGPTGAQANSALAVTHVATQDWSWPDCRRR